jgi:hypothetical protein
MNCVERKLENEKLERNRNDRWNIEDMIEWSFRTEILNRRLSQRVKSGWVKFCSLCSDSSFPSWNQMFVNFLKLWCDWVKGCPTQNWKLGFSHNKRKANSDFTTAKIQIMIMMMIYSAYFCTFENSMPHDQVAIWLFHIIDPWNGERLLNSVNTHCENWESGTRCWRRFWHHEVSRDLILRDWCDMRHETRHKFLITSLKVIHFNPSGPNPPWARTGARTDKRSLLDSRG